MNTIIKKILSRNDTSEVYEIYYNNSNVILKIHRDEKKFINEVKFLKLLAGKNKVFPRILQFENLFSKKGYGYIIESKLLGVNLLEEYDNFNKNEKINILKEAAQKLGYLNRIPVCLDDNCYKWKEYFFMKIPKWINNIKLNSGIDYKIIGNFLINKLKNIDKETENLGIIHRDYGFRNLLVNNENTIIGILDFEHAMIGDILFDTTKFIFNNINFFEKEKVNIFLNEWMNTTGVVVVEENLWIYLAVQGLGVIQWCDSQKEYNLHEEYRMKGEKILFYSLKKLHFNIQNIKKEGE